MNRTNANTATLAAAITLAVAAALLPAQAAPQHVTFSVVGTSAGGTFSYDDAAGAGGLFGETEYALTDFSFDFGGSHYGLADLAGDSGLVILGGGALLGIEAVGDGAAFSFLPGTGGSDAFLVIAGGRGTPARSFDLEFRPVATPLPLPGSGWLALAALIGAVPVLRRKR